MELSAQFPDMHIILSSIFSLSLNIFYCPIEAIQDCNTWLPFVYIRLFLALFFFWGDIDNSPKLLCNRSD